MPVLFKSMRHDERASRPLAGGAMNQSTEVRQDDVFYGSEGLRCAATLYRPARPTSQRLPAVVMGHGFASVRQMHLPRYAPFFVEAGIAVLAIDYRFLGESEGQPRQQVIPSCQREDFRNALTWLAMQPDIDGERLGIWGTSFAGGQVLQIAAFDRRVKAVVSQVPAISLWREIRRTTSPEAREALLARLAKDRLARYESGVSEHIKITAPADTPSVLGPSGYEWHAATETAHPTFHNEITVASLDAVYEFDPGIFVESISPTPLLMIVAARDQTAPAYLAEEAFGRALEPKKLVRYDGDHYDVYDDPATLRMVAEQARDFFVQHLTARR
jgi:uncharacterized protein